MTDLLEQQRARLLSIVDVELGRIHFEVQSSPLDREQRATLEAMARILKELEKRETGDTKPGAPKDLTKEQITEILTGEVPRSGPAPGVL
jgi:hypothetical protein